jgi:toxin ParE1/3/4
VSENSIYAVQISRRAERDLEHIQQETLRLYGEAQVLAYAAEFKKTFAALIEHPMLGHMRADIPDGYRAIVAGKHMVVYRVEHSTIKVVTVLHGRMDFATQCDS